jgi:hypothetical protein
LAGHGKSDLSFASPDYAPVAEHETTAHRDEDVLRGDIPVDESPLVEFGEEIDDPAQRT